MPADPGQQDGSGSGPDGFNPHSMTRIMLRPMASALPLGFFAFGTGTILLTVLELKWLPLAQDSQLMKMVLAFVVPLEVLAGLFAFVTRDVGAATALTVLGASWAATALVTLSTPAGGQSPSLGIFLLILATIMLVLLTGAVESKPLFAVLLGIGACRFALTGVFQLTGAPLIETVAGWIGVPLAGFSLYGGLALLLEDGRQQTVLPLGRRGRARASLEGDLASQIEHAEREAGVRRQL
jgi:succinate-acetate transporter protein